ncbi:hypothetical protein M441DRAFT_366057 [Trichoderma asperellum CBS 433.97]|uniref:Secreted protein n=1 Tax=Trichoderma asperellum (strain ATCC 204424 / CBS 433.97 / NBRC 101777) TaxID=1042311 RepID=A0A2T3ZE87_TRIA4|nr:hypothetical protein M441DRAFT_366057 [Trichoderma asperellum CBS 433.97]PTB43109.1 hypothetical protein M441DRAFT_366057 [Trichoderma asperellum CBS 433.97]
MFKRHGVFWLLAFGCWLVFWCARSSQEQKRRDSKPTRGAVLAFAQEHWILFHPYFSFLVSLLWLLMKVIRFLPMGCDHFKYSFP